MKRDITQEAILYKSFVQIECTCIEYHHVINVWHARRTLQCFILSIRICYYFDKEIYLHSCFLKRNI